ncbi:MAG TPA: SGNH/GDSL hydrolase family protein [Polyangiaceae bacterium]|nr:SGNH/GDSL hydrolase family protein [Polyangiaceae bacterium]
MLLSAACSDDSDSPSASAGTGGMIGAAGAGTPMAGTGGDGNGGSGTSGGGSGPGAGGTTGDGGGSAGAGGSGAADQGEPGVRFVGRVDTTDAAGARFAWSGTGIIARFSGTEVAVRMNGAQQYTVVLDGEVQAKLTTTGGADAIATGLADGEHAVEIYRRTEANQGESQFLGFELGAGQLLAPPAAPERRIEVIGDSISCGYGNEGADETCGFTPDTENHYLTYGAIAARNVGADLVTVAWSGKGVVCNYGDEATACTEPMPLYYDRTLPNRADSVWDFAQYQPQAVVINLGTNDFSTAVDPTDEEFVSAYVELLERVRTAYPDALILCTVGPLLNGADLTTARTDITTAVQQRIDAGDDQVQTFELAPQDGATDGLGCDYHPSLVTHEKMADVLTSKLAAELGW